MKAELLKRAEQWLRASAASELWEQTLSYMRDTLTADEVEFCLRIDQAYTELQGYVQRVRFHHSTGLGDLGLLATAARCPAVMHSQMAR